MPEPFIAASVRQVVEFVLRTGDLGGSGRFSGRNRAIEGTRGHQRLQKNRPPEYLAEVPVQWQFHDEAFTFELKGRIDGVLEHLDSMLIEEIKTVQHGLEGTADPLHWAQAKIYAWIYGRERERKTIIVQLTYLDLKSGETEQFQEHYTLEELRLFFDSVLNEYLTWVRDYQLWIVERNTSIDSLKFPFSCYRPGQRSLAVAVYRSIKARQKLFVEAPTGIGKTVSVLFPALKSMAEGQSEKIFYATAKTSGRIVAQQTLARLRERGLHLRSITLTARDKICFNNGERCDLRACPFAQGYYDRVKEALRDALQKEAFNAEEIQILAEKHRVCPFELSLDLSLWVDAVICDYNYVFDPSVSLHRYFDGERHDYTILVDEAHNLVDRAREMFSAELDRKQLLGVKERIEEDLPACAEALGKLCSTLSSITQDAGWTERGGALVSAAPPSRMDSTITAFLEQAEVWLTQDEPSPLRDDLLEAYFLTITFKNALERYDEHYVTIYQAGQERLRLYCVDPSALLHGLLRRTGSTVFFSATLRPIPFFQQILGGDLADPVLQLVSPFPPQNMAVLIHRKISTTLQSRSGTYEAVAEAIEALARQQRGNYLVFFPSYSYLAEVETRFRQKNPDLCIEAQTLNMKDVDRERFLSRFEDNRNDTLLAFAVLGGVFGEGIDLIGDRLIGAVIVGVGLPQLCLERDLIKERGGQLGATGFDYAYTFPGMNRVLQAVGRVIRSETDRGIVLLIDERFAQLQYRKLLPSWWNPKFFASACEIASAAAQFWSETEGEQEGPAALAGVSL